MTQFARPSLDESAGGWTAEGGPTDLYDCLNEVSPSETDYIEADGGTATECEIHLSNLVDPVSSIDHTFGFRAQVVGGSGGPERLDVDLVEGTTVRAIMWANQAIADSWTLYEYTLDTTETDSIVDYTNLRVRIQVAALAGGEQIQVSWAEFKSPDAPAADDMLPWDFKKRRFNALLVR